MLTAIAPTAKAIDIPKVAGALTIPAYIKPALRPTPTTPVIAPDAEFAPAWFIPFLKNKFCKYISNGTSSAPTKAPSAIPFKKLEPAACKNARAVICSAVDAIPFEVIAHNTPLCVAVPNV